MYLVSMMCSILSKKAEAIQKSLNSLVVNYKHGFIIADRVNFHMSNTQKIGFKLLFYVLLVLEKLEVGIKKI